MCSDQGPGGNMHATESPQICVCIQYLVCVIDNIMVENAVKCLIMELEHKLFKVKGV